tara:strand:- start:20 stop:1909 length:1890 start_codon:yes stop_codon:yes gene_type:complete
MDERTGIFNLIIRMNRNIIISASIFLVIWTAAAGYLSTSQPEIIWNWNTIEQEDIYFPRNFIWGTATAAHQVEGNNTNNNWYRWETSVDEKGNPRIHNDHRSGMAADHWNRYPEDILLMKELGVSHYRFSVEWSKIEPNLGKIDENVLNHYRKLCQNLIAQNITPVITLHHFSHPIWFENMGAFEKDDNIKYFLKFSEIVFNYLHDLVPIWCTINEPAVFVSQGYFNGVFPPGKKDPQLAGMVMQNMLNAHVKIYHHLKRLPGGKNAQIGLVKNIFQFDPLRRWHILDWLFSKILNDIFTNHPVNFFNTGKFKFYLPGMADMKMENINAIGALDFIGLNYYSRYHVKGKLNPVEPFIFELRDEDIQTDMPYSIYPEGFYRALHKISEIDQPIYVTENGIADSDDDQRATFIRRYLYAMHKAINDGLDIRGYFYWTLMDNFEWSEGYQMKFGLYEVDFSTQKRILRKGSKVFQEIVKKPGVDNRGYIISVGDTVPDISLEYVTGEKVTLRDLRGQVIVLQFTASWCSVCRQEMPHLEEEVWKPFKDNGLILIGIDRDEPIDVVQKFIKDTGVTYPIALDPGAEHFSKFAPKKAGVTRNIVIDKDGRIAFLTRLFDKEEFKEMISVIETLL